MRPVIFRTSTGAPLLSGSTMTKAALRRGLRREARAVVQGHGFVSSPPSFVPTCDIYSRVGSLAVVPFIGGDGDCPHHAFRPEGAVKPDVQGLQMMSQMFGAEFVNSALGLMRGYVEGLPEADRAKQALRYSFGELDQLAGRTDPTGLARSESGSGGSASGRVDVGHTQPCARLRCGKFKAPVPTASVPRLPPASSEAKPNSPFGLPAAPPARNGAPIAFVRQVGVDECLNLRAAAGPTFVFYSASCWPRVDIWSEWWSCSPATITMRSPLLNWMSILLRATRRWRNWPLNQCLHFVAGPWRRSIHSGGATT